ncbi:MAG TPA: hypothetical protein VEZ90_19805 [Blastocatellia bacterium]|nr:hypothetical protein [Blastocatellia bacterium]
MSLADFVRRVKAEKRLSFAKIAENSGNKIGRSYVSKILNGEVKNVSEEYQGYLALGLQVPIDEVVRASRGESPPEVWTAREAIKAIEQIIANPALTDVVKILLETDERDLEKVLHYVRRYQKAR